jgi:hypothetical protein
MPRLQAAACIPTGLFSLVLSWYYQPFFAVWLVRRRAV